MQSQIPATSGQKKVLTVKEGRFKAAFVSEFASCGGPSPWWFLVHFPVTEKADGLLGEELGLNGLPMGF